MLQRTADQKIHEIVVESGSVEVLNVPTVPAGESTVEARAVTLPPATEERSGSTAVQILASNVTLADSQAKTKFGVEGLPVILKPGVRINARNVTEKFAPAAFNPDHTRFIARSPKAKPMAVNMYSGWWSLVVCLAVTVAVSLVTKPKPEVELKNLVMGLTPRPEEGPCPWWKSPKLWTAAVIVALVAVNIIFW
jgi:hypothetical protein